MTGIEGVGFAVELFVLSFSFLCWLVTPATQECAKSQSQEVQKLEQEQVKEAFEAQEEQPKNQKIQREDIEESEEKIQQPSQDSELNELQKKLVEVIHEKITLLKIKEVRAVAKLLGIKQFENRQSLSKAELMKRVKRFVETVELQEQTLLEIKQHF